MRRRAAALLLALLALTVLVPASVSADETIYFTAVNETVLELSDSTMPFWSGGYLYVASTIFSGKELGVYYSRNNAKKTVVLYTRYASLAADMNTRTLFDGSGNQCTPAPIERNGVIFLPLSTVAQFFGLTYSSTKITITTGGNVVHGYLIRVKSSGVVLSDASFTDAAATQLISRYQMYDGAKTGTAPPATEEENPPGSQETPPTTGESAVSGEKIYLCLAVRDMADAAAWLDALDKYGMQATFYFPPEKLEGEGDLLRRMAATGQGIGFLTPAEGDGWTAKLEKANRTLMTAAGVKTRLILPVGATSSWLQAAKEAGWCPLQVNISHSARGMNTASAAAALLKRAEARKRGTVIWLDSNVTAAALRAFLAAAQSGEDRCLAVTETVS